MPQAESVGRSAKLKSFVATVKGNDIVLKGRVESIDRGGSFREADVASLTIRRGPAPKSPDAPLPPTIRLDIPDRIAKRLEIEQEVEVVLRLKKKP